MARVTVATTTPDPAYPGEVLLLHSAQWGWGVISNTAGISAVDGDNTTTARTGSSTYPWFSFDLGGSFRVTRLQVRQGEILSNPRLKLYCRSWAGTTLGPSCRRITTR